MTNNVFENGTGSGAATSDPTSTGASGDPQSSELIGEGKKYASTEAALAALPHKESHIATLEAENAQLRAKVGEAQTIQQVLDAIKSEGNTSMTATEETTVANQPQDVSEVVRSVLQEEQQRTAAENNVSKVNAELATRFGDEAGAKAQQRAAELGIDMTSMKAIAEKSPQAFLAMFPGGSSNETQVGSQHVAPTEGAVNMQGTATTHAEEGTQAYYDNLMRTDRKAFMSKNVQIAKMRAAMSDPDKYFGKAA